MAASAGDNGASAANSGASQTTAAAGPHGGTDVHQLAEKVYRLLIADARLGRARGELPLPPTRKGEG